ncbi:MAG: PIN domain-containing protein [Candidatus Levybacteria bacterium]|nr:PIN domain-containing protein [Candidatus Levybacteria bacterium]
MEKERKKIFRKTIQRNNRLKAIVLDTNILIDNVHGFVPWVDSLQKREHEYRLILPTIVVAEYLTARQVETTEGYERSKRYLSLFEKMDLTVEIAEILGQILRRKTYSQGANTADLIIASTAIYLDGELATNNRADFAKIPDLRLFDPKKLKN